MSNLAKSVLLTIEEAAEYLRFHPSTVYRLARQGLLPARKIGKQWRLDSRALDEWLLEPHVMAESASDTAKVG